MSIKGIYIPRFFLCQIGFWLAKKCIIHAPWVEIKGILEKEIKKRSEHE